MHFIISTCCKLHGTFFVIIILDSLDVDVETNICYEKLEELMVCMKCKMMEVIILMFCFEFHTYLEGTIGGKGTFFAFSNMFKNSKLSMVGSLCSKLMKSCIAH